MERTYEDLLKHSTAAFDVKNSAISITNGHQAEPIISIGRWPAEVGYYLPIVSHNDQHMGHHFISEGKGKKYLIEKKQDIFSELARSLGDILYLNQKIQAS